MYTVGKDDITEQEDEKMDVATMIHERIKDLRKDCDLTLEQLEAQIGLSKSSLGRYEGDGPKDQP